MPVTDTDEGICCENSDAFFPWCTLFLVIVFFKFAFSFYILINFLYNPDIVGLFIGVICIVGINGLYQGSSWVLNKFLDQQKYCWPMRGVQGPLVHSYSCNISRFKNSFFHVQVVEDVLGDMFNKQYELSAYTSSKWSVCVSVPRLRCGECPGKRGGPPRSLRPSRHQETCTLDRRGRNLPLRLSGQVAHDINPQVSAGSEDLHTRPRSEPVQPPTPPPSEGLP